MKFLIFSGVFVALLFCVYATFIEDLRAVQLEYIHLSNSSFLECFDYEKMTKTELFKLMLCNASGELLEKYKCNLGCYFEKMGLIKDGKYTEAGTEDYLSKYFLYNIRYTEQLTQALKEKATGEEICQSGEQVYSISCEYTKTYFGFPKRFQRFYNYFNHTMQLNSSMIPDMNVL